MLSLQRGSSAISTFPLHLVLYEGVTQINMVIQKGNTFFFPLLLVSHTVSFFLHFFTPMFLAMSDFLSNVAFSVFFSPLICSHLYLYQFSEMQPPALNVIWSKPTLYILRRCCPCEKYAVHIKPLTALGMLL